MWQFIYQMSTPKVAYRWALRCTPYFAVACLLLAIYGLYGGLVLAPTDYQQGDVYRILYLHVPAAVWSLGIYVIIAFNAAIFLIWKIKLADMLATVSAPIGALLTFLTLLTGSLWGKPTWGTFWIWDARLTSELVLLFIYLGIIAIRQSFTEPVLSAKAASIVALIGLVNIPIVHFSVTWWNTLHQGATLLKWAKPSIAPAMLYPLISLLLAYFFYYLWYVSIALRREILYRERKTQWVKQL